MSMGFLGIQFGFALQNANASRILQTFGADVHELSWFWLVAPITGMIVQPIIGYFSDRTWGFLGRRRPYFLLGAILSSTALILMPNAPYMQEWLPAVSAMFIGGGMLFILDASINISMEPFRALVADKLPQEQHTLGFSVQTVLIGIGAVFGSFFPYILNKGFDISQGSAEGKVGDNVVYSFYFGAAIFLAAILWTIFSTKEYPPAMYAEDSESKKKEKFKIPPIMFQLLAVQFFSWFALFSMWVFFTPALAKNVFGVTDPDSPLFKEMGDWVGVLFGIYNGVSAVLAMFLPRIAARWGKKQTHALALLVGGISFISIFFIRDQYWLIAPMVGIGFAWASILCMPYAMLANAIPAKQMGMFMGLFNMSITIPQIINGLFGGLIVKYVFGGDAILSIVMAGVLMLLGAVASMRIKEQASPKE